MTDFHGRDLHFADFQQLLQNPQAKLVTSQGLRRIGKSTFITQCAAETTHFISISGLPPRADLDKDAQLVSFSKSISQELRDPSPRLAHRLSPPRDHSAQNRLHPHSPR